MAYFTQKTINHIYAADSLVGMYTATKRHISTKGRSSKQSLLIGVRSDNGAPSAQISFAYSNLGNVAHFNAGNKSHGLVHLYNIELPAQRCQRSEITAAEHNRLHGMMVMLSLVLYERGAVHKSWVNAAARKFRTG